MAVDLAGDWCSLGQSGLARRAVGAAGGGVFWLLWTLNQENLGLLVAGVDTKQNKKPKQPGINLTSLSKSSGSPGSGEGADW